MINEKITFIKPINEEGYAGYKVITTEQVITFGIANESNCCEQWGYFMTNDDAQ